MDDVEERFARMWRKSREDAGKSQDYIARKLHVSKKTVQNWEAGYSCPTQLKGLEWFDALGLQALPYYLEVIYPSEFTNISAKDDDKKIEEALIRFIKGMRPHDKRKLLFIMYGDHGSSFSELMELLSAHFHTPLENRITIAQNVCTNYEIAEAQHRLIATDHIMPDIPNFKKAIIRLREKILRKDD